MRIEVVPVYTALDGLADGSVIRVLPEYTLQKMNIYALHPSLRYTDARIHTWIEILRQFTPTVIARDSQLISYGGPGAVARARLALDIVRERLVIMGVDTSELRFDLIGVNSLYGDGLASTRDDPYEVRVRVAGRTSTAGEAARIGNEVETLYTNGHGIRGSHLSTRQWRPTTPMHG